MKTGPKVGDIVGFRDKPNRTVVKRFTDACGGEWIDYTITKQIRLEAWNRAMRGATNFSKASGTHAAAGKDESGHS